jgi:hypothetical protein
MEENTMTIKLFKFIAFFLFLSICFESVINTCERSQITPTSTRAMIINAHSKYDWLFANMLVVFRVIDREEDFSFRQHSTSSFCIHIPIPA